jgi:hypothetical protein
MPSKHNAAIKLWVGADSVPDQALCTSSWNAEGGGCAYAEPLETTADGRQVLIGCGRLDCYLIAQLGQVSLPATTMEHD